MYWKTGSAWLAGKIPFGEMFQRVGFIVTTWNHSPEQWIKKGKAGGKDDPIVLLDRANLVLGGAKRQPQRELHFGAFSEAESQNGNPESHRKLPSHSSDYLE
jgi:hypothetical protein